MKTITIIGASRGVGLLTVKQALANGHNVIALSQNLSTLPEDANLTKIQGSATNVADVKNAISGSDAVIVTIGSVSTKATTLYTEAAAAILQAFKETGAQIPLIVLTGFGAGDSAPYNSFIARIVFALMLKKVYANKTAMEEMIAQAGVNWEIVRPGMLSDKPFTGNYRQYTTLQKGMRIGSISRADVAYFLVSEAEGLTAPQKYISLTN